MQVKIEVCDLEYSITNSTNVTSSNLTYLTIEKVIGQNFSIKQVQILWDRVSNIKNFTIKIYNTSVERSILDVRNVTFMIGSEISKTKIL